MKKVKKIVNVMLAAVMALAMSITAFAGEETTPADSSNQANSYTITINNDVKGHQYDAYQIFAGDLFEEEQTDESGNKTTKKVLSNIQWGTGITDAGKKELGDAAEKAEALAKGGEAKAKTFAVEISKYLADVASGSSSYVESEKCYKISGLPAGYYLIKDNDEKFASGSDTKTAFILEVVSNTEATPKNSKIPTPDKKVQDTNDTTGVDEGYNKTADYDIGDNIPYQLSAKLPENVTVFTKYQLTFEDKLCEALDYVYPQNGDVKEGVVITFRDNVVSEGYTVTYDNHILTVKFDDIMTSLGDVKAGEVITVDYSAKLNNKAEIGQIGNKNELKLIYSNDPNSNGTGTTKPVEAIVFTFKTVVNKVNPKNQPLEGAEFTLSKYSKETEGWETIEEIRGDGITTFEFKGLDDGRYRLEESKTPEGYNTIQPVYFEIVAQHDDTGLTKLEVFETDEQGTRKQLVQGETPKFDINTSSGTASTDIVNEEGSLLPSTGGIGTTIFYIIGGILVIGAGIILVVKKRMSHE